MPEIIFSYSSPLGTFERVFENSINSGFFSCVDMII